MLENHPRVQLCFILEKHGRSIINDSRRCQDLLTELAPEHQRETDLLMQVLEQKIVEQLLQHNSPTLQIDALAQGLHDKLGMQKDHAHWAIESWLLALNRATDSQPSTISNTLGMEFVKIPQGSFMMGSPENEAYRYENEQLHEVNIAHDFYLSKHLVTQAQWQAIMGDNPSGFEGDNLPVEQVSWFEAQKFIAQLNDKTGQNHRLPTEAEWEYACRAGTSTPFYTGHAITTKDANFNNSIGKTSPVDSYPANPWGLYDMSGNLWEWTASAYDADYKFSEQCASDDDANIFRVLRGGSWESLGGFTRSASRLNGIPAYSYDYIGFRILLAQTVA